MIIPRCCSSLILFSILLLLALGLLSCSSAVTITAQRYSGIVLDTTMIVDVGTITGDNARAFREELIKRIQSTDYLNLAEGPRLPSYRSAVLLIEGSYWSSTAEEFSEEERDGKTEEYRLTTYSAEFNYEITDMLTRELVIDGMIGDERTEKENVESKGIFEAIVEGIFVGIWEAIFGTDEHTTLRRAVARKFVAEISPRDVTVEVTLFEDSGIPELETGIGFARAGRWKDALRVFLDVIDRYPNHKNLHKGYYNAGVAYEFIHQYSLAREFLEEAVRMSPEREYRDELWRCRRYEQEYRWREGYLEKLRMRGVGNHRR